MAKGWKLVPVVILAIFLAVGVQEAKATAILQLSDGSTTVTIPDGSGSDLNALAGVITFSGTIGNWTINVSTGQTSPFLPGPQMDLNTVNTSTQGGGTMTIKFTNYDLSDPLGTSFLLGAGGTTEGTVNVNAYFDASNAQFGTGTLLASIGPFSGGAFSGSAFSGVISAGGNYSLTEIITIDHAAGDRVLTSLDASLAPVPEPGTMLLLGSGLVGLAGFGRKKLRK